MALTASRFQSISLRTDDEGAVHYFARESQTMLRWVVRGLLVITALTMVTFWFWAIVPATLLIMTYLMLLLTREIERRSRRDPSVSPADEAGEVVIEESITGVARSAAPDTTTDEFVSMPLLKHEAMVVTAGIAAVMIIAIALATIFFGGAKALLAALFFAAYILLIGGPVWLAAFEDDIEVETGRLE